jgi:hypothetical protein
MRGLRVGISAALLAGAASALAPGAWAQSAVIDLGTAPPVTFRLGDAVNQVDAGDVNGDGVPDAIIATSSASPGGRSGAGSTYVVFGAPGPRTVAVDAPGAGAFRIDGARRRDGSGVWSASAGDVNGDGLDDVVIGADGADPLGRHSAGVAYVVFGKRDAAPVDLAALGSRGYRIAGAAPGDRAGYAVAGANDVNGDGLDDVIVGAYGHDASHRRAAGAAYVVFGKRTTAATDLRHLGRGGMRLTGATQEDRAGYAVSGAGDVNGDRRPDLLVGADHADHHGRSLSGSAYVVFGSRTSRAVDLAHLHGQGFRIDGASARDRAGFSVWRGGDVNGDGLGDVLVSAYGSDNNGPRSGSAYVILGRPNPRTVDLATIGRRGFRIDGERRGDRAGFSIVSAGDANGDGLDDTVVSAPFADHHSRHNSGSTYVVYGNRSPRDVGLRTLGDRGFRIDGTDDKTGFAVGAAGDLNGDGRGDVLLSGAFSAYIVFSP